MPTYPTQPTPSSPTSSSIPSQSIQTPTYGPSGTFTVLAQTTIQAPPLQVLNLIRDTSTWPEWNSFCPHAEVKNTAVKVNKKDELGDELGEKEGWLNVGMEIRIDVHMNGDGLTPGAKRSRTQDIEITHLRKIEKGEEVSRLSEVKGERNGKGYMIAWKSVGWKEWQLKSERVMEFREVDGGAGTEYMCWET
jgi:hypothetical protein